MADQGRRTGVAAAVLVALAACGAGPGVGPVRPGFPPGLDAEVQRAQTEIVLRTAGACTPQETAVLTEGMALHAAAVSFDMPPSDRALLDRRAQELRRARQGFSFTCRKRIGAWPVGPVQGIVANGRGLAPVR